MKRETHQVAIIGAGPAGLAAAIALKRVGVSDIVVIERDGAAGGMPQYCHHAGFGLKDLHMIHTGPGYARTYAARAAAAGVTVKTQTSVTGWAGPATLAVTSPDGLAEIEAKAVLLATGCRERPRAARMVPGTRAQGVFTTGALQQMVHENHYKVGKKAVIVGAELISFSALLTLGMSGTAVARMVTDQPQHQLYWPYTPAKLALADIWMRTPVQTSAKVTRILGNGRVEGVEITGADGKAEVVECDTVIFTCDWIPQNELARSAGIAIDPGTRGPRVDALLRTSAKGVFAAGNLLRGAESADNAAIEGRYVAGAMHEYLQRGTWANAVIPIEVAAPLQWVAPNAVAAGVRVEPGAFLRLRASGPLKNVTVRVQQGERVLYSRVYAALRPNTSEKLDGAWLGAVQAGGGPVRVTAGV